MEQGHPRKQEDVQLEVGSEGVECGVTAERGTNEDQWMRQEGCLEEAEGSLA